MNKKTLISKIKNKQINYSDIDKVFLKDEDVVCELLRSGFQSLYMTNSKFRNNKKCVIAAIEFSETNIKHASEELKNDPEIINMAIEKDGNLIGELSKKWRNDKALALKAVKNKGEALFYLEENLKDDYEIVLTAIKQSPFAFQYISKRLKGNEEIIHTALMANNGESAVLLFLRSEDSSSEDFLVKMIKKKPKEVLRFIYMFQQKFEEEISFLLKIREEIIQLKDTYPLAYETIINYEREQKLINKMDNMDSKNKKKKNKI